MCLTTCWCKFPVHEKSKVCHWKVCLHIVSTVLRNHLLHPFKWKRVWWAGWSGKQLRRFFCAAIFFYNNYPKYWNILIHYYYHPKTEEIDNPLHWCEVNSAGKVANSADSDQTSFRSILIQIYNVCFGTAVQVIRIFTVLPPNPINVADVQTIGSGCDKTCLTAKYQLGKPKWHAL